LRCKLAAHDKEAPMPRRHPYRRGIAESALFYLVVYGIGASAMVFGGLFDSFLRARRRLTGR
jgi:hypothetical protein